MLQRIQSIYLLIASLLSGIIIYLLPFWTNNGIQVYLKDLMQEDDWRLFSLVIGFGVSALFSLIAIFLYKNRKQQVILNRINIVVNFYLLGIIVYFLLMLPGESQISENGIGLFVPVLVIVFVVLATKAIQKDEKLVKSVDRLR